MFLQRHIRRHRRFYLHIQCPAGAAICHDRHRMHRFCQPPVRRAPHSHGRSGKAHEFFLLYLFGHPEALFPPGHRQHGGLRDPSRLPDPRLREPGPGRPHRLRGHWHRLSESPVPEDGREFQDPGDLGPDSGNRRPGSGKRLPGPLWDPVFQRGDRPGAGGPGSPGPGPVCRRKRPRHLSGVCGSPEERIRTRILPEPPQRLPLPW